MNVFLEHLSASYLGDYRVLVCDGAAWHKSGMLKTLPNIELMFIPHEVFRTPGKVMDRLCDTVCNLTAEAIRSITGRSWIMSCFN
jgi:hypothetical protein